MLDVIIAANDSSSGSKSAPRPRFGLVRGSPRPRASSEAFLTTRPRVLLIEDDAVTGWMVRNVLGGCCDLKIAGTGTDAIECFNKIAPDIVFLDINLPDFSGFEVLRHIREASPQAKVVMFTHHDALENMSRALAEGASGFIAKPFRQAELLSYILPI